MDTFTLGGAQWWDYAMLLTIACAVLLGSTWLLISWLSRERITYLEAVDWFGRFNAHEVYGVRVAVQCRHRLRKQVTIQQLVVVHALTEFRNNETWEEVPFWLPTQIGRYLATHNVPVKPYLELMHCVVSRSRT